MGKALRAAVELLAALVGDQGDPASVDETAGPRDPVGVPAYHGAYVAAVGLVGLHRVVAQDHVHRLSVPVRDPQGPQGRAVGEDLRLQSAPAEDVLIHRTAVPGGAEGLLAYRHRNRLLICIIYQVYYSTLPGA